MIRPRVNARTAIGCGVLPSTMLPAPLTVVVVVSFFCTPYSLGKRNCRSAAALWLEVKASACAAMPCCTSKEAVPIARDEVAQAA